MDIAFFANADNIHTKRWARFLTSRGHKLTILCDPPVQNPPEGIRLIHPSMCFITQVLAFRLFPKPYGNNFYKRFPYRREVARIKPDIVHAFEALGYGYALARCGAYPKVLTPWGNDILYDPKKSRIARFLVTRAVRSADIITTNFLELVEHLKRDFAIPQEKIRPFSWGVDLDTFHPGYEREVENLRRQLGFPPDARIIISNRAMKAYWGIETIARALPKVFREIPSACAVFLRGAGDAEFEAHIKAILEKAGVKNRVRFITKFLSEREMAAYLNLGDAFISAPKTDLLSISLLEGMACGCAPILADLDAYKKRVQDGINGLCFRPDDGDDLAKKIITFFRHPEWKQCFAKFNIEQIRQKDDWEKNALQLEDIYKELIAQKKRSP